MIKQNYRNIIETLYINSVPGLSEEIRAAAAEPLEDCYMYDEKEEW